MGIHTGRRFTDSGGRGSDDVNGLVVWPTWKYMQKRGSMMVEVVVVVMVAVVLVVLRWC